MHLKETMELAWKNRDQIANGLWNRVTGSKEVHDEAARRKGICESNECGYYDPEGKPGTSAIPGKPACSICHCNIEVKTHCMYCWCALRDLQVREFRKIVKEGMWPGMFTQDHRDQIQAMPDQDIWKIILDMKAKGYTMHIGRDSLWDEVVEEAVYKDIVQKEYEAQFKPKAE